MPIGFRLKASDVLPFVAEVRDARRRAEIIDKAFPDGIRGRRFDQLIGTKLYHYQKEGALFAARAVLFPIPHRGCRDRSAD